MTKICAYCGKEFEHQRKNKVYCCSRCADNSSKVSRGIAPTTNQIKICPTCGKEFETVYIRKIYCSKHCYNCSDRERERKRNDKGKYKDKRRKHNLIEYQTIL